MAENVGGIEGLTMYENIVTEEMKTQILEDLNSRIWDDNISRRTQHYNYRYPYNRSKRLIDVNSEEGRDLKGLYKMKDSIIIEHIKNFLEQYLGIEIDQCIVNEYDRNDKIGGHTDDEVLFGDTIVALSILEPTLMRFKNKKNKDDVRDVVIPSKSLIVMRGKARYEYTHEIPGLKSFKISGGKYTKPMDYLRISLTFRKVKSLKH